MHEKFDRAISVEELSLNFFSKYPAMKQDEADLYKEMLSRIADIVVGEEVVEEYFRQQELRQRAIKIAETALSFSQGGTEWDKLEELFEKKPTVIDPEEFVTDDLQALYEMNRHQQGLRWPLNCLNKSLGSLRGGDFGFIIARPEVGKTTFLSHVATFMTEQHDGNTLWINNEEQGSKVKVRNFQSLLCCTTNDLFADIGSSNRVWNHRIGNRLRLYDSAGITTKRVEQLCAELNPKLVIIDQLDKIKGLYGEGHGMLKELYQWARELSKRYNCPVIGVSQASVTGEDKLWLTMEDIDGSKTGKPGEADFIIGIGKREDQGEFRRGISIIKNKLSGDEDTVEALRHMRTTVCIRPEIAQYEDVE